MNRSKRKTSIVRRFVARFSKFRSKIGKLFSVSAASPNPEPTKLLPPTCESTPVQTTPSSLKLSEISSNSDPECSYVYVSPFDIRHMGVHECDVPITFDFWDHRMHRGCSRQFRRRQGIANTIPKCHDRMNLKGSPKNIEKNAGVSVPGKRKNQGCYCVFPSCAHPPNVRQTSATKPIKSCPAPKTLPKTRPKRKVFENCGAWDIILPSNNRGTLPTAAGIGHRITYDDDSPSLGSPLKQRFSTTITSLPAPAFLAPISIIFTPPSQFVGTTNFHSFSPTLSSPAAIPILSYHDLFARQIIGEKSFSDQFLAFTADQTKLQQFSHSRFRNNNREIPVPDKFGKVLPDALTPAQKSNSPTFKTPTTPSSSFFSDTFTGSTPSATPITPAMDFVNRATSSPDKHIPMEGFVPSPHPPPAVLPVCGSCPPPTSSSTAPAAAAESSPQVPTPSTIEPTTDSPPVLTLTSSQSSHQPTASASPKNHIEVEDYPSASESRKGRKRYRCRCGKRYERPCDLTKHMQSFDRVYPCPYKECEYHTKKWSTKKDLERHLDSIHGSRQRHILCGIDGCKATKPRKDNMQDHLKRKHFQRSPELVAPKMAEIMNAHAKRIRQLDAAAKANE